jgi:hypothetical protein
MNLMGVSAEWEERPGDGTLCKTCKDPIFYKAYVLIINVGPEREETNAILCESCYNKIDDE